MLAPSVLRGCVAGQEAGQRAGVVSAAVAEGERAVLRQSGQYEEIVLERPSASRVGEKANRAPTSAGRPIRHVHPVGDVEERHALRRPADRPGPRPTGDRDHGFQPGQGDRRAQASQDRASRKRICSGHHRISSISLRLVMAVLRNGSLWTTPRTRDETW